MRLRRIHLLHSAVALAVVVQLGFAAAFLADAVGSNRTYDALSAHQVAIAAQVQWCNGPMRRPAYSYGYAYSRSSYWCSVAYTYGGRRYLAAIPVSDPRVMLVDPKHPQYRMSEAAFRHGPVAITADVVFGSLLLAGAFLVAGVHQYHLYLRRRDARRHPRD